MLQANRQTFFAQSPFAKAVITSKFAGKKLFIAESKASSLKLAQCLKALGESVVTFDEPPTTMLQISSGQSFIRKTNRIYFRENICVVMAAEALATRFISKEYAKQNYFTITKGQKLSVTSLCERVAAAGFLRVSAATDENSFSQKGDVIDLNIKELGKLFRVYFFGSQVEQIFELDSSSFKRVGEVTELVFSAIKNVFSIKSFDENKYYNTDMTPLIKQKLKGQFEKAKNDGANPWLHCFDKDAFLSVSEVFKDFTLLIENPGGIRARLGDVNKENENEFKSLLTIGEVTGAHKPLFVCDAATLFSGAEQTAISFQNILASNPYWNGGEYHKVSERVLNVYGSFGGVKKEIDELQGKRITLFVKNDFVKKNLPELKDIQVRIGDFGGGVVLDDEAVLTLRQDGGSLKSSRSFHDKFVPKEGDFVVHAFHGIGHCKGLVKREIDGEEKDFFALEYQGGSLLLVPCENADAISRFSGGGETPKLNVLGGQDFEKVKGRVRASLKKIAFNLAALFKERIVKTGFKFNEDCELQHEFDARFPHEETAGQLAAIADVKADMCSTKIMDRLICGDVGFGKTEIALRAAFKAVLSGKQVLFLAPTTILCFQHYINSRNRFAEFGVKVALLNRFVPVVEQKKVVQGLADGTINIVFGTHKLLSDSLKFFDLGLLIIDEEQRFGTAQKEKLKNIKKTVDVLAMTATPIPRTLHLSLIKVRDVSIIDTPPKNRVAPIVYVCDFSLELMRTAIEKELSRGGQTFVIFNNIEKIDAFALSLKNILPDGTVIDTAHARLPSQMLEGKVENLYSGKTQVFVSTTIVENGLDIKNANTIIVVGAERFGLADLYQLKGRVGRTADVQAYAYFMTNQGKVSEAGEKRLNALSDFSNLGDGFEIAMKDLEIRGSGNVFGAEQSGHLNKVGYTEFVKIVDEVVAEALGEKREGSKTDVVMEVKLPCFVPESFEADTAKRIEIYKFLQIIEDEKLLDSALEKIRNEYGAVPSEIENLAYVVLLKNKAKKMGATKVLINNSVCELVLDKAKFELTKQITEKTHKFKAVLKLHNMPIIVLEPENDVLSTVKLLITFLS